MPVASPPPELVDDIVCNRVRNGRWLFVGVSADGQTWIRSKGLDGRHIARIVTELVARCRRNHNKTRDESDWPYSEREVRQ